MLIGKTTNCFLFFKVIYIVQILLMSFRNLPVLKNILGHNFYNNYYLLFKKHLFFLQTDFLQLDISKIVHFSCIVIQITLLQEHSMVFWTQIY